MIDTDDDGGPCPVCDEHAGESLRCHICESYVHDGCVDSHGCATRPARSLLAAHTVAESKP